MKQFFTLIALVLSSFVLQAQSSEVFFGQSLQGEWTGNPESIHEVCVLMNSFPDLHKFNAKKQQEGIVGKAIIPDLIQEAQSHCESSQAELKAFLVANGIKESNIKSYWIENAMFFKASESLIEQLFDRTDILEIHNNDLVTVETAEPIEDTFRKGTKESGLGQIGAPFMWKRGYTGYGTKIFIIDSGVDPDHKALQRQYAWHNQPLTQTWIGTNEEAFPADCDEHGTHVLGTALGLDRLNEDTIGVAFNAQWYGGNPIGCNVGFPRNSILDMFQWALNPDGNTSTTDDVPDVMNNSWGDFTLGYCPTFYRNSMVLLESADVAVIFSAGNAGPDPRTLSPPHNLHISEVNPLTVAALEDNLSIADFSSRGPSRCIVGGQNPIKPEVAAPGVSVRSSIPGNKYASFQGTSMAAPHVAGACALLMEAFPNVSARDIKTALYESATDLGPTGEDNDYGNGLINLEAAYNYLESRGNNPFDPSYSLDIELWDVEYNMASCKDRISTQALVYNGGRQTITSLTVEARISGSPFSSETNWSGFLSPGEYEWISLDDFSAIPGSFTLVYSTTAINGRSGDDRELNNNLKRRVQVRDADDFDSEVAADFGAYCVGSRAYISLSSNDQPDSYQWYDALPLENVVHTGKTYTPQLESGENRFWVIPRFENRFVGPELPDNDSDLDFGFSGGEMEFTVYQEVRWNKMDFQSSSNGVMSFICIRNGVDTVVESPNYPCLSRKQTIPINQTLPAGDYVIKLIDSPSSGLAYMGNNTSYPYSIDDVISFTGSSPEFQGVEPYFYFFNWDISYNHPCGVKEVLIDADQMGNTPTSDFNLSSTNLTLPGDATLRCTNQSAGANEYEWIFDDGATSSQQNPNHTYTSPGEYYVTLIAKSANDCTDATTQRIVVTGMTSSDEEFEETMAFSVYPNPVTDILFISSSQFIGQELGLIVYDQLGRKIQFDYSKQNDRIEVETSSMSNGIYFIQIKSGSKSTIHKFIKS